MYYRNIPNDCVRVELHHPVPGHVQVNSVCLTLTRDACTNNLNPGPPGEGKSRGMPVIITNIAALYHGGTFPVLIRSHVTK